MKKSFFILLSVLSLTAYAQQKKTVAVLEPICRDSSVNTFYRQMVRGAMESGVTASVEYKAYDRAAFDLIQKEQAFQRNGTVDDSQIREMGKMAGVDYVLVSEVSAYDHYLSAVVKILNVTTGAYDKSVDNYARLTPEDIKSKCREMASSLFKGQTQTHSKDDTNIKMRDGSNVNISGRRVIELPKPVSNFNQEGIVIVRVQVNEAGYVVSASHEGGTVSDRQTIQIALEAARKTVFSAGDSEQIGTITYNFKLR